MEWAWEAQASCYGLMDDTFFPDVNGDGAELSAMYRTCFDCPVKLMCRVAGIGEKSGIWGGSSPTERQAYRNIVSAIIPNISSYEWYDQLRAWTDRVLDRAERGMDLAESLKRSGLDEYGVAAVFANTNGDRFAMRTFARQDEVTTMGPRR